MTTQITTTPDQETQLSELAAENQQLLMTNPADIEIAKQGMTQFFESKLAQAQREWDDCQANLDEAMKANLSLNLSPFSRQISRAKKRWEFYDKCLKATQAGYVLVPDFPGMDAFMIRTNKKRPTKGDYSGSWYVPDEKPQILPAGAGEYKDPQPLVGSKTYPPGHCDKDKSDKEVTRYFNDAFLDEVEYPMSVAQPQVISELSRAAQLKVFDDFGISPARRAKGDPIVTGRIYRPNQSSYNQTRLTFLVAWYIDTRTI